jgi:hypothetical protein
MTNAPLLAHLSLHHLPFSDTIYSFEMFNIQTGEMTFCKPNFIIIKSNYFQNAQNGQCFLDDFETLVRKI